MKTINNENNLGKSLRYSLIDGIFATIMGGIVSNYITPFALALKADNFHIGLLNSLPSFFGIFAQLKSPDILEKVKSRVKIISRAAYLEALMCILLMLIPLLLSLEHIPVYLLITFFTLIAALGTFENPIWASLMSDTVNKEEYGRYFAWRNRIFGVILLTSIFFAGIALDWFKHANKVLLGFAVLFAISAICRFISAYFISRMTDIPVHITEKDRFTYKAFLFALPKSNYARFVIYVSAIVFAETLAGAFFTVYMFDELKFSYTTYMIINTSGALAGILTVSFWGHYSDKIGNVKVIKTTSIFMPLIPILWIFSKNPVFLILVNMFSSYIGTGFHLAEFNFRFDACTPAKRARAIAYSDITKSIAASTGALLGGFLAMNLPGIIHGSKLMTLFVLSGILKFLIVAILFNSFREVRTTEKMSGKTFILTILGGNIIENFVYRAIGKKAKKMN